MKRVVIETPFSAKTPEDRQRNDAYLRAAIKDSIDRGEAPYASHAFYTHYLDDDIPHERTLGMEMGFVWGECAEEVIVYADLGLSNGMKHGIATALSRGQTVTYRTLGPQWVMRAAGVHIEIVSAYANGTRMVAT